MPTAEPIEAAPPRLIDAQEFARRLGCSTRHIWRLRDAGKLPPSITTLGAMVRWPSEAVDDWIRRGCPPASRTPTTRRKAIDAAARTVPGGGE